MPLIRLSHAQIFPCQPLDVASDADSPDPFVSGCVAVAAVTLFSLMAAYAWILIVSVHICRLVALVRKLKVDASDDTAKEVALELLDVPKNIGGFLKIDKNTQLWSFFLEHSR